eukprot:4977164-Amphidinium_carterae.1
MVRFTIPAGAALPGTARHAAATPTSTLQFGPVFASHSNTMPTTFQRAWALGRERGETADVVSSC